ncbi:hypothetical protein FDP41_007146 [Naegleria fowleri]|uniref:Uncharacterized protein n=1 Tax=Naegleria fowleri TaxID=5763 RepID=A0A6A5BLI5_NAEFO|nr:uncharacterized protein FDP41_007146 [Naegleria fowleri]KAF0973759.1 hypothetical protein FDP41_007146 [Naegleria fowleri]CAG4715479.1 unnamed protein product [Naegleria fowleri]
MGRQQRVRCDHHYANSSVSTCLINVTNVGDSTICKFASSNLVRVNQHVFHTQKISDAMNSLYGLVSSLWSSTAPTSEVVTNIISTRPEYTQENIKLERSNVYPNEWDHVQLCNYLYCSSEEADGENNYIQFDHDALIAWNNIIDNIFEKKINASQFFRSVGDEDAELELSQLLECRVEDVRKISDMLLRQGTLMEGHVNFQ